MAKKDENKNFSLDLSDDFLLETLKLSPCYCENIAEESLEQLKRDIFNPSNDEYISPRRF